MFIKIKSPSERNILTKPIPLNIYVSIMFYLFFCLKKFNDPFFLKYNKFILILFIYLFSISFYSGEIKQKFYHIIQYIIPSVSILVGYFYFNEKFLKGNLVSLTKYFLTCFIIFQVIISLLIDDMYTLKSNLIYFTIYQNIQYVTSIIVLLIFSTLLLKKDKLILDFFVISSLAFYSLLSLNFSTILIFLAGLISFLFYRRLHTFILPILFVIISTIYFISNLKIENYHYQKFTQNKISNFKDITKLKIPENLNQRAKIYNYYLDSKKNLKDFLFGNSNIKLMSDTKGAHNIFLDSYYIFGILFTVIVFYFSLQIIKSIFIIKFNYFFFFFSFYFFVENIFKEALKQPYPAIIIYLIFGHILKIIYQQNSKI